MPSNRKTSATRKSSKARASKSGRRKRSLFSRFGRLFYWTLVLGLWGGIGLAGIVAYYGAQMPSATTWAIPDRPPNVKIVSADGQLVANRGITGGEAVGLHEMSPYIPQAVMAIEDRRFYSHFGIDPIGLARAFVENVLTGTISLPVARYKDEAALRIAQQRVLDAVRAIPGVDGAGMTTTLPLSDNYSDSVIMAEGYQMRPGESLISPSQVTASRNARGRITY